MKLVLLISLCMTGVIACLSQLYPMQTVKIINEIVENTKNIMNGWKNLSVSEECCHKMRYLVAELSRKRQLLSVYRHTLRLSKMPTAKVDWVTEDYMEIDNLDISIGNDTKEWDGQRVNLWGIVPLWQSSPSPEVVLSLENPRPGDCWPFSGTSGSLRMHLPGHLSIRSIRLEHVRPDTAQSAPEYFEVIGIRADGVPVDLVKSVYRRDGPSKQYFPVAKQDKLLDVIFYVKSNQGNPKYTCIYRIQLYTSTEDYKEGFWRNI